MNVLDFTDRTNNDHIEKLRCFKQRLDIEFADCNVFKLIHALNIIDHKNVLIVTNNLDSHLEKNQLLTTIIFIFK